MDMMYVLCPPMTWFLTGSLKFAIHWVRPGTNAVDRIGSGGFPSNHTAIVASTVMLVALTQGVNSPVTGLGVAVLLLVIFDATSLRRQVGLQARRLNELMDSTGHGQLRESTGHSYLEVFGGLVWGAVVGYSYLWAYTRLVTP